MKEKLISRFTHLRGTLFVCIVTVQMEALVKTVHKPIEFRLRETVPPDRLTSRSRCHGSFVVIEALDIHRHSAPLMVVLH